LVVNHDGVKGVKAQEMNELNRKRCCTAQQQQQQRADNLGPLSLYPSLGKYLAVFAL